MTIALAVFIFIFAIFIHEIGHALMMKKYGIGIKTFSIGLPFPLKIAFRSKSIFNGALLQITPLIFGAFVKPTDEGKKKMKDLPYKQQADIYGAGPLANLIFSGILFIFYGLLKSGVGFISWQCGHKLLITLGISVALFWWRKLFSRYIMIPAGVAFMVMTILEILKAPMKSVAGPVGIAKIVSGVANFPQAILIGMLLSLSIGLFNALPLMPLDGGRICKALIERYVEKRTQFCYALVTGIILASLFGLAVFSDFINLAK